MKASPQSLPCIEPSDMGSFENIELALMSMDEHQFQLLYDDWAWDNRPKNVTKKEEIVKMRAKRSINSNGDENLKTIEEAFENMGAEEALAHLNMISNSMKRPDKIHPEERL